MPRPMKHSGIDWLGDIPADWKVTRIKHLCNNEKNSFQDGDWIESPFITEEGIRYLTTGNVGDGIFKRQGSGHISEDTFAELNCKYAYPNDLVISRLNAPYGRACILPSDEDKYVLAVDIVILRTDHDKRYLCYLMQCQGYQNSVQDAAKGTTMKRISRTNLGNIYLPIPPPDEQQRIAAFLDDKCARIDSVIEKTRASVEEYKKLKQALITRAVTKGIRPNRPMKQSGVDWLGDIPESYNVRKIKHLGSYRNGLTYTPNDVVDEGQGTLILRSSNVQQGKLCFDNNVYVGAKIPDRLLVQKGDIIICSRNGSRELIGKCAIIENDMTASFGAFMMILRCDSPKYMYYILNSDVFKYYLSTFLTSTINQLTGENFGNMKIVWCDDKTEQKEIAQYLDEKTAAIDSLVAKKNQLAEELTSLKKSLIFEYVTGKKEVPT